MNAQEIDHPGRERVRRRWRAGADGGGGGGSGVRARPVGAFVITDGDVHWEPAIDATRLALRGMLIPIVGMIVARSVVKPIVRGRRSR
ncbi:MAG TPA: hypothetical protein VGT60_01515 [Candidatus Limnocylindria bacterium]|nr:hypothetical protein [Candidatus Limnocylindria bacterium]